MHRRRLGIGAAIVLVVALATAACGGSDTGATSTKNGVKQYTVAVGYQPVGEQVLIKIGDKQGFFKKHGITIKYPKGAALTGSGQVAQLLNGQLQAGLGSITAIQTAVSQNIPIKIVSALSRDSDTGGQTAYVAVVGKSSSISSFKDLEGKTVAVNSLRGNWEVGIREAIVKQGGDATKVKLVAIPFPDQSTALRQGRVDAIATLQPIASQLMSDGFKSIGDPQAIALGDPHGVSTVTFMSNAYIAKNPDAAKQWVASLADASKWANSHPADVRKYLVSETKAPAAVIAKAPLPAYTADLPKSNVDQWYKLLIKYGVLKKASSALLWKGAPVT